MSNKFHKKYLKEIIFFVFTWISMGLAFKFSSVDKTYQKGIEAYSGERWSECIAQFEESLYLYKMYKTIITNCRLQCNSQRYDSDIKEDIEDLKIYERFFNTRDCLNKCQEKGFEDVHVSNELQDSVLHNMQARKPYEYLHICYFQMNALPKAASAVYTYLVANPDNEQMKNNMQYYIEQPEVDVKEVVDLLSEDYMLMYKLGKQAYNKNNWRETIASMEEVLSDYLSWENSCRVECERQPEQEWSPEFVTTLSNNIASLLHCRQQCQDKVKLLGFNSGQEFLADVLNYLQICFYRLDNYNDAAKSVASFLVLVPNDEDMLENKNIYGSLVPKEAFEERSDIVYYLKRDTYEKQLLNFFHRGNNNEINSNAL